MYVLFTYVCGNIIFTRGHEYAQAFRFRLKYGISSENSLSYTFMSLHIEFSPIAFIIICIHVLHTYFIGEIKCIKFSVNHCK